MGIKVPPALCNFSLTHLSGGAIESEQGDAVVDGVACRFDFRPPTDVRDRQIILRYIQPPLECGQCQSDPFVRIEQNPYLLVPIGTVVIRVNARLGIFLADNDLLDCYRLAGFASDIAWRT